MTHPGSHRSSLRSLGGANFLDFLGRKPWKITIFNGKKHGKSQALMGQLWKIIIFSGKTMEHHHFVAGITHFKWPCSIANILPEGRTKD